MDIKVNEKRRVVVFKDDTRAIFHDVKWFNFDGSYLRIGCEEGYVLLNKEHILYMIIDGEKVR